MTEAMYAKREFSTGLVGLMREGLHIGHMVTGLGAGLDDPKLYLLGCATVDHAKDNPTALYGDLLDVSLMMGRLDHLWFQARVDELRVSLKAKLGLTF